MGTNDEKEFKNAIHDIGIQVHKLQSPFGKTYLVFIIILNFFCQIEYVV